MANKAPLERGGQSTLQRGKACLRCRKRKMRCDGDKPACQQCTRAKKGDACEYDDGKGKTRTQLLREHILRLEQRVRELEDPEYTSPSVTLYDPHAHSRSASSSSSFDSPISTSLSVSHSPFPSESTGSPQESWNHLPGIPSPSPSPFVQEIFYDGSQTQLQPPIELAQMLLDIFAPHGRQCGLDAHIGRIRDSLSIPSAEQHHPALLNAIYLWACFISRPEPLCQHEDHYLESALNALRDALRLNDKILDVIQASCLLSLYFLANGRFLEGGYHASAAAALAVQCGLDGRLRLEAPTHSWFSDWTTDSFDIKLPLQKPSREVERMQTFWQVYNLDRCWSVILRKPCVIPDILDARNPTKLPWPQEMADFELGCLDFNDAYHSNGAFFHGDVHPTGFAIQALRIKASALFSRAEQLTVSWDSRPKQTNTFRDDIQDLENTINQFITTLIPVHQLGTTLPEDQRTLIVTHTLAHAAIIQLYSRFAQDVSYDKCSRAARDCVAIINHISDREYSFLEPIIGPCWVFAAETLIRELDTMEASWPIMNSTDAVRNEIGILFYALNSLSVRFPLVAVAASKIQKRLAEST